MVLVPGGTFMMGSDEFYPDERPVHERPVAAFLLDRYEVRHGDAVVGYVDVVGPVFVALVGMRYDRATEVAQTLTFLTAIAVVAAVADD
ncbi:MAG: SUMF1/EgtB/PvdO family nonheme iron enzyme [Microbacterium sp.]|nr:SUMF1/EgtB/PvdO family nonheme iron enzyme [Microbacterium sp.]